MKSYYVDELGRDQVEAVAAHLTERGYTGPIEGIYWLRVPENLLTEEQQEHLHSCGPFIMSLETGRDWLKLELLVRATQTIRCTCVDYASREQQAHALELLEQTLQSLNIAP